MNILLSILLFIGVLSIVFIPIYVIIQKGKINAKNDYVFRHKFNGSHPYMNQSEMHYHICDLLDKALKDKKKIKGIEFRLIIDNENENEN